MAASSTPSSSSPSTSNLIAVTSAPHFQELLSADLNRVSLINFWAPWAAPCTQMNAVVAELAKKHPAILALNVEAEEQADIAESFDIEAVPSFVVLRGHTLLARIAGADAPALTQAIATHTSPAVTKSHTNAAPKSYADAEPPHPTDLAIPQLPPPATETPEELEARLRRLMAQSRVVLFMKGVPDEPRCGFSRKLVALLRDQNVKFSTFDILRDEDVRQGLKKLNDWPTFPQLIVSGELVGGLDIVQEMVESGEFKEVVAGA
ncbi:glutaredoxin [Mycena crocata]|nr:glutaredoxin [Mycena crocata]